MALVPIRTNLDAGILECGAHFVYTRCATPPTRPALKYTPSIWFGFSTSDKLCATDKREYMLFSRCMGSLCINIDVTRQWYRECCIFFSESTMWSSSILAICVDLHLANLKVTNTATLTPMTTCIGVERSRTLRIMVLAMSFTRLDNGPMGGGFRGSLISLGKDRKNLEWNSRFRRRRFLTRN